MRSIQKSNNLDCPHLTEDEETKQQKSRSVEEMERGQGEPGEVYFLFFYFYFFVEGQFCDSLQTQWTLSESYFISPSLLYCPSLLPFKKRWRDDQEAASVKTANQYNFSVWDEAPRLHWKSQMANDSFKLPSWLWTFKSDQSLKVGGIKKCTETKLASFLTFDVVHGVDFS